MKDCEKRMQAKRSNAYVTLDVVQSLQYHHASWCSRASILMQFWSCIFGLKGLWNKLRLYQALGCATIVQVIVFNLEHQSALSAQLVPAGTSAMKTGPAFKPWEKRVVSCFFYSKLLSLDVSLLKLWVRFIFRASVFKPRNHPVRRPFLRGKCNTRSGRHLPFHP